MPPERSIYRRKPKGARCLGYEFGVGEILIQTRALIAYLLLSMRDANHRAGATHTGHVGL